MKLARKVVIWRMHSVKTLPLFAACLLAGSCTAAWSGAVLDRIKSKGTLVIAHREASVPFSYIDADKKPMGYAVDLCLRVADLECSSTTNTPDRRKLVAFTVPHYITGTRYMVRADSPIQVLADFQGKKLSSTKTTAPLKAITKANADLLLGITLVEAPEHVKAVEMVEKGEVDGFAMDDVLLYGLMAGRPEPGKLKVVGKFLTIEPLAIMLSKDDAEFKRIVDDEMKRLVRNGDATKLYDRWFLQPIPPKNVALNLPMNYLLRDFWKYPTDVVPQ